MLTAKDLETLIGQRLSEPKAQKIVTKIGVPGKKAKNDDSIYHTYAKYGLDLVQDADSGRIASIFLYAKSKKVAQYAGELPDGLKWSMTQDEIRGVLGEPDQENGDDEDQWHRGRHRFGVKFKKGKPEFFYYSAAR